MPRKNSYNPSEHVSKVILTATRAAPGIRSDALAKETALHETTVSTAGRVLIGRGLLTRVRKGRHFHYYPAGAEAAPEPQQLFLSNAPLLEAEVAELRAFKARALGQYPELDVEPIILEARKIAYRALFDAGNRDGADNVLHGHADDTVIIEAIVTALRRAEGAE
jgi:hypothetical protein